MSTAVASLRRYLPATVAAAATASTALKTRQAAETSSEGKSTTSTGNNEALSAAAAGSNSSTSSTFGQPKILFLGSGSSTGCPKPICALAFPNEQYVDNSGGQTVGVGCSCRDTGASSHQSSKVTSTSSDPSLIELQEQLGKTCSTSKLAAIGDPRHNKNYRNNPSILISHRNNDDNQAFGTYGEEEVPIRNVIIDCGKTFRETAIRWMPQNGIRSLDAIVLTHEHMDAVAGLDDVRGFQRRTPAGVMESTPVFLSQQCLEAIKRQFFYLVPPDPFKAHNGKVVQNSDKGVKVVRAVASLQYNLIEKFKPFCAAGLTLIPLPVMHGEDLVCLGFAFTVDSTNGAKDLTSSSGGLNVVYLSDISRMLPETEEYILKKLPPTDVLVIDSLLVERNHPVHYSLKQAIELARKLKPKKTYVVGINCDDFKPHGETNDELKKVEGLNIELAYDGLVIDASL